MELEACEGMGSQINDAYDCSEFEFLEQKEKKKLMHYKEDHEAFSSINSHSEDDEQPNK